ncbi:MAG: Rne/Rng family ribonuclease [Bifidobacterium sp.]
MQRAARSIVPNSQEEGLVENKTSKNTTEQSEQTERPHRRRGGRRVVRVAGAANADVPVRVESRAEVMQSPEGEQVREDGASSSRSVGGRPSKATGKSDEGPKAGRTRRGARGESALGTSRNQNRSSGVDKVEFEAPVVKESKESTGASTTASPEDSKDDSKKESAGRRSGRRSSRKSRSIEFKEASDIEARDASRTEEEHGDRRSRAQKAVESLPTTLEHHATKAARPMTSLLFQEPVIPTEKTWTNAWNADEDDDDSDGKARHQRRSASATSTRRAGEGSRAEQDSEDAARTDSQGDESSESRHKTRRSRRSQEEVQREPRARRAQRLNAQERRAAAEVEQIEGDLEFDEIRYAPIDEDEFRLSKATKRRRSRGSRKDDDNRHEADHNGNGRSGGSDEVSNDYDQDEDFSENRHHRDEGSESDGRDDEQLSGVRRRRRRTHENDADEDSGYETTRTQRRRRRRSAKVSESSRSEENSSSASRRSRKQQYIDEITDIQGSTRLEAKRQRRRDNRRDRSRQMQLVEQDFLARRENVKREMVVREKERHTQISVIEDDILVEHYVSDIQEVATVGNIYLGRVQNVLPSMEAAFVDIGQARNGVLYAGEVNWDTTRLDGQPRRIELAFKSGDPVLVQVTKDPIGHKGARLTSQVTLAGRFLVLVPSGGMTGVSRKLTERERTRLKSIVAKIAPKDMGVIIRTAAENASEEAITKDLESLTHQWEAIERKRSTTVILKKPKLLQGEPDVAIRVVRDIFNDEFQSLIVQGDKVYGRIEEYLDSMAPDLRDRLSKWNPADHQGMDVFDTWHIDGQLRKGMERQVYLPSGGSLVIDRTEAMTTIDVNTGRYIGKGKSLEETVTRCNLEAAEEIARQLRLRDIGGMVMIDFVDMVMPANRDLVLKRLLECLARDRTKHQVAEVTSLGLVQMTRKRVGQGLVEAFSEECPTCKGRGFILHDEPTVSASYDDPYALKGGDPFVKTKHGHHEAQEQGGSGVSSPDVKEKLAKIAAAAQAASTEPQEADDSEE